MKKIWYHIIKIIVKTGLLFLLKKIKVFGKEHIPKKGATLFIANHQNALIDAILIPTTNNRETYFLARASAFKTKIADKLLRSVNMIPIYRFRDGYGTIEKNYEIFNQCTHILKEEKAIQIFPEGEHHLERKITCFKKGFTRIILGTLSKYPELPIKIVPVGINYDSHLEYPGSVSIYYGKVISANRYFNKNTKELNVKSILKDTSEALKKLTLHIEEDKYEQTLMKLQQLGVDFLNPVEANTLLKNINNVAVTEKHIHKKNINWLAPIYFLAKINSIFPFVIWKFLKSKIKDVIFYNTYRFAVIMTLFPLFYLIQTSIIYFLFGINWAAIYLAFTMVLGIITTKTKTVHL